MQKNATTQSEELLNEVRELIDDTEGLMDTAATKGAEEAKAFKEKLQRKLKQTKIHLQEVEEELTERAKVACKVTDEYVHENPYKVIGITAFIAFLLGLLISRR